MTSIAARVAARYKSKKKLESGNTLYQYSERQVALRNSKKAERLEKLRKSVHKLRAQVKKDLRSGDPERVLTALAVGLMDHTAERVGNSESAEERGHFGVTGWQKGHVSFGKGKATVSYTGKSGVKQKKHITDKALISALKDAHAACEGDDLFCQDTVTVDAPKVNAYLKAFDITAKDLRGLHANTVMQQELKAVRSKGGELPADHKEREKQLKAEFKKALEAAAEAVGHEASTLRSQYLVPGLEDEYMKGRVMDKMVKTGAWALVSKGPIAAGAARAEVEQWKADLRRMTKIYKSIPAAPEEQQLELLREARGLFNDFRRTFEEWVYRRVLPPRKEDGQTWEDKHLRETAWTALGALSDLFPRVWDSRTDKHEDAPWELKRKIETNVRRYQRAFVEAFKAIDDYLDRQEAKGTPIDPSKPRYEKHSVGGMQVIIDSYGREDESLEPDVDDFMSRLSGFAKRIRAAGFGKALEGLTITVAFDAPKGLVCGQYSAGTDTLEVFPLGFIRSDGGTFTHEVGHRFWYKELTPRARARWSEMFEGRVQQIQPEDVHEFVDQYVAQHRMDGTRELQQLVERQESDPTRRAKYIALTEWALGPLFEPLPFDDIAARRKWMLDRAVGTKVHVEKISDYATESPVEAFAEAFRFYIVKGPGALGEWTRWFFKEVARSGGAKLAARVAERFMAAS